MQALLPLGPLQIYGNANGLRFERLIAPEKQAEYDAVLLIEQDLPGQDVFSISAYTRRYLMLLEHSVKAESDYSDFDRVFLPVPEAFRGQRLIRLNQPLELPLTDLQPRPFFRDRALLFGRDCIELEQAHFALCDADAELTGWLSTQWQKCLLSGVVPVSTAIAPIPDWFPVDCYVDGTRFASEAELRAFLDGMTWTDYQAVAARLRSFLMQGSARPDERIYPYTVDYWINALTSAIALDASQIRGGVPSLSVVIPAFNYGRYLKQAVHSLLNQEVDSIEVLVLDNASTDDTQSVMATFAGDPRVRYMRNRRNFGAGNNSHNGFWVAKGRYLILFMADDFMNPGHVSRILPAMEKDSRIAVGYSPINWVNEQGNPIVGPNHPGHRKVGYIGGRNEVADLLVYDSYITPSAAIIRREAFFEAWQRDTRIRGSGDWMLMVQLAERFPDFVFTATPGVSYRAHAAQHSNEFYASSAPLEGHICILEGVFERRSEGWLKGREREVAAHLERRLRRYPQERSTELGMRAQRLCERLEELARQGEEFLFSVILTTYNRPAMLKDALASLKRQCFRDFEVIVTNDNGEPVEALLEDLGFPVTYLRLGKNGGPAAARNAALRLARGRYVTYLDDDDVYLPDHLRVLGKAVDIHPDKVVYSDAVFIVEKIDGEERLELTRGYRYRHDEYSRERLFVDNYIPVNTFACPRSLALGVGGFDEKLSGLEDWDFLLRLAARVPFHHVQQETVEVRMRQPDAGAARRSEQALKDYPSLYQELYSRHADFGSEIVRSGRREMLKRFGIQVEAEKASMENWLQARSLTLTQKEHLMEALSQHGGGPLFGVVLLDLKGEPDKLKVSLDSLSQPYQAYSRVQHFVLTTNETAAEDGAQIVRVTADNWLSHLNGLLSQAAPDWFVVVSAGEEFTANGLLVSALDLVSAPNCRAVYADEMMRQDSGEPGALLRPDLNLDLLLSLPASMARHWLFCRDIWMEMGGFSEEFSTAFELEYILRLIETGGFDGLGHISEPLLTADAPALQDNPQEREVITRHLVARGYPQPAVTSRLPGRYEIDYGHPVQPKVSILIVVKDRFAWVQRCMDSLLAKTAYKNFEVLLLDHGNTQPEIQHWLSGVEQMGVSGLRVLRFDAESSREQIQNQAALRASGEYLLWLGDGAGILSSDWLKQLLNHAQRPEVGAVGGKLISGDGLIRHAGGILGLGGPVGRAFLGYKADAGGYLQRLQVDQNSSALSGLCMMVRRELFIELGGFAEEPKLCRWADADLCLRLQQAGYLNVWTPRAQVLMDEPPLSNASAEEEDAMYERWLPVLARDPAYNPNFALNDQQGFKLAPARFTWKPMQALGTPVVLAHNADATGCGQYRVIQPHNALKEAGLIDGQLASSYLTVTELERYNPDSIILQRQIGETHYELMRRMKRFSRALKVFELDDYIPNLPVKSVHRAAMPKDIVKSLRRALTCVDRFVVSTEPLAEAFAKMHGEIQVVKNSLDPRWWKGLSSERRVSSRPRVGWAGGSSHTGDLEMIADVVKELASEVEWVFFGMCPDKLRPYVHEFHPGIAIEQYPAALARMNLDLALAPVEQNLFNECKSNLRLLEYGACGFPVVCSDLICYQGDLPVTRVRNRFKDWVDAIRMHLADLDATAKMGDELRAAVHRDWMLEGKNLEQWRNAWLP
ncbi:glycosyltransferase [Pseudomonas sp. RL]|uniref:glycosyltransferase n=1 Tax=Pseudomonas sp. RL TaxID=1452718 RepID=UPI0009E00E03|nr:glycosyltransferase [Pseudomonas sp. RL]